MDAAGDPAAAAVDLAPALKDAYLRKAAFGRSCETVELTFHVLRRALGSREREPDRVAGFRFRDVHGVATEAVRWDRDAAKWVAAKVDWLGAVARDQMERPIIGTAVIGGSATLERWRAAAENLLWLRGKPEDLEPGAAVATAPVLFEISTEVILPNGWNANARVFIAAGALDIYGSKGPVAVHDLLRLGEEWERRWREYWDRRKRRPELPEEPQYEWIQPGDDH
jgi:hypothetical protein